MAVKDQDLKEAHSHLQEEEVCIWAQESDWENSGDYYTDCGCSFSLCEGTPEENGMKFCCFCGKKIVQALAVEDQDEA